VESLPQRLLEALEAAAPDTHVRDVCGDLGFGDDLVATWCEHAPGFRDAYDALARNGRRRPLDEGELARRLERYLRELELHHVDKGEIDRTAAAKRAGVSLTDVVRATDREAEGYDPEFARREYDIIVRQRVRVEDVTLNLGTMSKKEAEAKGFAFQQMSQNTTYLKTWSPQHMKPQQLQVEGHIQHDHAHQLVAAAALHRELRDVRQRFLPSKSQPKVVIVEANS
jgi:hypothetical protein